MDKDSNINISSVYPGTTSSLLCYVNSFGGLLWGDARTFAICCAVDELAVLELEERDRDE